MPHEKIKLLIVDDEASTRELMTQIFTSLGHNVTSAEDGFTALAEIRKQLPDIILSDLNMPGMSGFELLSVVRRRFPAIQAIAMSGAFSGDAVQPGVAADAFYEKASKLPILLQIIETMACSKSPPLRHAPSPIWILSNGHTPAGKASVTIVCPDCFRTFPQIIEEDRRLVHETDCIYCETLIHYAILAPTDAASPQAFQRKAVVAVPLALLSPASGLAADLPIRLQNEVTTA
jgi:CheY-like chemotaxis protein